MRAVRAWWSDRQVVPVPEARSFLLAAAAALGLVLVPLPPPAAGRAPATPSDFNGDGYADLAIGVPSEAFGPGDGGAGAVNVLYGSRTGITAAGDQLWHQNVAGVKGRRATRDRFGAALASGDFDRDGYADLAIGAPRDLPGDGGYGAVNVLYGSRAGLTAAGDQLWSRVNLPEVPGDYAWDGGFGAELAASDFDADGFVDLAMAMPDAPVGGVPGAGLVVVLRGSRDGLTAAGRVLLTRALTGAPYDPAVNHEFGKALAAGDFDGDGFADLAVGAPAPVAGEAAQDGGSVVVFTGDASGLDTVRPVLWSQASPGIASEPSEYELFGASLAAGDFDADGRHDLAIGVPGEARLACPAGDWCGEAGAVHVLRGSTGGLIAIGSQLWHLDAPGVPGTAVTSDQLGAALAAGDLDGDGRDDLAIGAPWGRVGAERAGFVTILYGSAAGLAATRAQRWTEATPGVPGTAEEPDGFGASLAIANWGRSGRADLAVGAPGEEVGGERLAGAVAVLYGRAGGLSADHAQRWSQRSRGVLDTAEGRDRFGSSLTP